MAPTSCHSGPSDDPRSLQLYNADYFKHRLPINAIVGSSEGHKAFSACAAFPS